MPAEAVRKQRIEYQRLGSAASERYLQVSQASRYALGLVTHHYSATVPIGLWPPVRWDIRSVGNAQALADLEGDDEV